MKTKSVIFILLMLIPLTAIGKEPAKPVSVDAIQVLKIAPQDQRAVIKTPDGTMRIIAVGDAIGEHARVTEIAEGRVVLEETKGQEIDKVIIRLENGKQRVERLRTAASGHAPAYSARTSHEPPAAASGKSKKRSNAVKKAKRSVKHRKGKKKSRKIKEQKQ